MKGNVIWKGGMGFDGITDSGFHIPLDAKPEDGGQGEGSKPLELFAVGLAGCTGMDVISILQKKRQEVTGFEVAVTADRADEHPRMFTRIDVLYTVAGKAIDPAAVERAIQLSTEKYCAAYAMLSKAAPITTRFEIEEK
jgi:putative redox protein